MKQLILSLLLIIPVTAQASPLSVLMIGGGVIAISEGRGGVTTETTYYKDGEPAEARLLSMTLHGEQIVRRYGYEAGTVALSITRTEEVNRPLVMAGVFMIMAGLIGL